MKHLKAYLLIGIVVVFFSNRLSAQVQLTLSVDSAKAYKLNKDVFGCNNWISTRPYYLSDSSFIKKYLDLHKPVMRYPGGTASNYLNLATGFHELWPGAKDNDKSRVNSFNNGMINSGKVKGEEIGMFVDFLDKTGAKSTFVMNMTVMSKSDIDAVLDSIAAGGQQLDYVEMGNELYFGQYNAVIPDVASYLLLAKERAAQVRQKFPDAKIGILVPSQIYTSESFLPGEDNSQDRQESWYEALKNEDFYDGLVIHLYSTVGMDSKITADDFLPYREAYKYAISHADDKLEPVMDKLKNDFPGKNIWVTEYHVGGFSGDVRNYRLRYSYLGGLYAANFMLKLFSNEQVTLSSWHSMVQWLSFSGTGGLLDKNYDFGTNVNYQFFKFFGEPVKNAKQFVPIKIDGPLMYDGIGGHTGTFNDVEGGMFNNPETGKGYLMLFNKWEHTYGITKTALEDSISAKIEKITELAPDKSMNLEEALEDENRFSLTTFNSVDDKFTIQPFSVYLFEYDISISTSYFPIKASDNDDFVKVYPNPSYGQFHLEKNRICGDLKWGIYSLSGQFLKSGVCRGNRTSIALNSKGPHILKFTGDDFINYKKIIIR